MKEEKKEVKYSDAIKELERLLDILDRGHIDIDGLADMVERADGLIKICKSKIKKTELRISKVFSELDPEEPKS